jgi:ubiquinone/menaquinone biosynthesis C-methylase UbiE
MIARVLEPEAMDTAEEVRQYDAMDHSEANARFVADFLHAHGPCGGGEVLDVGTGTARIPIALALADPRARIVALDLAEAMLAQALENIAAAGFSDRIRCHHGDAKSLEADFGARGFEGVISNSIVHHIPDPEPALLTMARSVARGGTLMVRDLARPGSLQEISRLADLYAVGETDAARALFEASLHAALTVEEIRSIVNRLGLPPSGVSITSDRHWTWIWQSPP